MTTGHLHAGHYGCRSLNTIINKGRLLVIWKILSLHNLNILKVSKGFLLYFDLDSTFSWSGELITYTMWYTWEDLQKGAVTLQQYKAGQPIIAHYHTATHTGRA